MVDELLKKLFAARDAAHNQHWRTKSFAQHEALGEFYDDVIDVADKYAEAHQGLFGQFKGGKEITDDLREDLVWIIENREEITKNVSALENIIDELIGVYLKTLYKLENLK